MSTFDQNGAQVVITPISNWNSSSKDFTKDEVINGIKNVDRINLSGVGSTRRINKIADIIAIPASVRPANIS